jgi:hypothetical protein
MRTGEKKDLLLRPDFNLSAFKASDSLVSLINAFLLLINFLLKKLKINMVTTEEVLFMYSFV